MEKRETKVAIATGLSRHRWYIGKCLERDPLRVGLGRVGSPVKRPGFRGFPIE